MADREGGMAIRGKTKENNNRMKWKERPRFLLQCISIFIGVLPDDLFSAPYAMAC
jgi:hypothetical protein